MKRSHDRMKKKEKDGAGMLERCGMEKNGSISIFFTKITLQVAINIRFRAISKSVRTVDSDTML